MAKLDPHKDYYAILGMSPTVETDEVKKQFKKLGKMAQGIEKRS